MRAAVRVHVVFRVARRFSWVTVACQSPSSHGSSGMVIVQEQQFCIENVDLTLETLHRLEELCYMLVFALALGLEFGQLVLGLGEDGNLAGLDQGSAVGACAAVGHDMVFGQHKLFLRGEQKFPRLSTSTQNIFVLLL